MPLRRALRAALLVGLLTALVGGALRAPAPATADVIPPGQKGVGYGCEIANLADYPDYLIIGLGINPALGPYQVLQAGNCDPFYKLSTVSYYAVRRAAFDPTAVPVLAVWHIRCRHAARSYA